MSGKQRRIREYEDLKVAVLAEAERYLARHKIKYDKVEFVCRLEDPIWDALCYVWEAKFARTLKIRIPDGDETSSSPQPPAKAEPVETVVTAEPAADSDNSDVPDVLKAA